MGAPDRVRAQPGLRPGGQLVAARTNTTPWLAPANADLRLEAGALAALLEAGARDPGAGALAPRLVLPDGRTQHSVHPFPSLRVAAAVNLGLGVRVPGLGERLCLEGHWNPERPRAVPWAHGALLLVRRRAWESAGGFDDAMWFYAEDLDLCWRLRRAGFTVRYVPTARVHHEHAAAATAAWGDERHVRSQAAAYAWMVAPEREPLRANVEVDEFFAGGLEEGLAGGRQRGKKALVGVAIEARGQGSGRLRLQTLSDASGPTLEAFVQATTAPGAIVHTDAWAGYNGLSDLGYDHRPRSQRAAQPGEDLLPRAHRAVSNFKAWLHGTHRGVSTEQLPVYLDEYVFRHNRRRTPMAAFQTLLGLTGRHEPTTYAQISSHDEAA